MSFTRRSFLESSAAALVVSGCAAPARRGTQPDGFIDTLISRMSLEEKAGQLSLYAAPGAGRRLNPDAGPNPRQQALLDRVAQGQIAGLYNGNDLPFARALQQAAVQRSRLGIPLIFAGDVIHGYETIYPVPLAEAASFDVDLCARTARAAAIEATALGTQWTFAPMVDVARDQRWGRVVEGAGEDPWLGARIAAARVRGFQGPDLRAENSLLACPKHFAAYGAVQGGLEYNSADIPETTLREVHLPPFKAAFDAGALSTMASFNDIGGVPSTANAHLLTQILRDEWGFRGLVISDYESDLELIAHGFAADEADAVIKALSAGCDLSMQSGLYFRHIPQLVRSGRLPVAVVDRAVRRVLSVKRALGLFDHPYRSLDPARAVTDVRRPQFIALAREAARKSIVLLKNERGLLPLPKSGQALALIGPFVSDREHALGPWVVFPDTASAVTLEEGVRAALPADAQLSVVAGSGIETEIANGIEAAVAAARAADVVVLFIGESATMSGEAASRVQITLPPAQQVLAEAVAATGKPMVVLLKHGRALELTGAVKSAAAILCTWFLGSQSGHAIADVIFGDAEPQGRLPVSFPQSSGQEPFYYDHRSTGRPLTRVGASFRASYREVTNEALYPFGHGLGYSSVEYGPTQLSATRLTRGTTLCITAQLTNRGARAQHEVAQLYVHEKVASLTPPVRALKDIRHLQLMPGESATVEFELSADELAFVHGDFSNRAEAGAFSVWIAPSSSQGQAATFELAGPVTPTR